MRAEKTGTEVRQEQILKAALDIIGTQGVHALSIAGIAKRVGIVPSAVYRHYEKKGQILDAVLTLLRDSLMDNVTAARDDTEDALGRLESLLMRHVELLAENRAIPHVIFSDGMYTGNPARKARVREVMHGYVSEIQKIILEGQEEGTIRQEIDVKATSVMFLGMVLPAAVLRALSEGEFDVIAHAKDAWPIFVKAISVGASQAAT